MAEEHFEGLSRSPIRSASKSRAHLEYVSGQITVKWPYADHDRSCSVILAEIRLLDRVQKGQVKITCYTDAALYLSFLQSGTCVDVAGDPTFVPVASSTPTDADYELHYKNRVTIRTFLPNPLRYLETRSFLNTLQSPDHEALSSQPFQTRREFITPTRYPRETQQSPLTLSKSIVQPTTLWPQSSLEDDADSSNYETSYISRFPSKRFKLYHIHPSAAPSEQEYRIHNKLLPYRALDPMKPTTLETEHAEDEDASQFATQVVAAHTSYPSEAKFSKEIPTPSILESTAHDRRREALDPSDPSVSAETSFGIAAGQTGIASQTAPAISPLSESVEIPTLDIPVPRDHDLHLDLLSPVVEETPAEQTPPDMREFFTDDETPDSGRTDVASRSTPTDSQSLEDLAAQTVLATQRERLDSLNEAAPKAPRNFEIRSPWNPERGDQVSGLFSQISALNGTLDELLPTADERTDIAYTVEILEQDFESPISYYPSVSRLRLDMVVDLMGVIARHSNVLRAKKGPKDFYMAFTLATPSSKPDSPLVQVPCQIFRPSSRALPLVTVGDAIVLRSFRIIASAHRLCAISTEESSWGVWQASGSLQIKGPALEWGKEEYDRLQSLHHWFKKVQK